VCVCVSMCRRESDGDRRVQTEIFLRFRSPLQIIYGKAVLLQILSGPEGSRKLRFPDFVTTAQDGGKVVSLTHPPLLPPRNSAGTHFC
jgi:hypothetical protein